MILVRAFLVLAAFTLTACAVRQVDGVVQGGREVFQGLSFREIDGGGMVSIASSRGVTCDGDFVYVAPHEGKGTFYCTDGRTGPFSFVATGRRGTGTGTIAGQPFVFRFS